MARVSRRTVLGGGAAVIVLGATSAYKSIPLWAATAAQVEMTPPEVLAAVDTGEVLLVDVRRPEEWRATGLARGAVPIDLRRDDFAEAVIAARETPDQPVVLICARGVRSRRMTLLLDEVGVTPIIDVPEGMLGSVAGPGWLKRDLPLEAWNG